MISFSQALGQLIADLRRERKLSQEKLSFDADIDRTHLGEIERGLANPTIATLEKLAAALDLPLSALISRAEDLRNGKTPRLPPTLDSRYLDRTVPLPNALTYERLEGALNKAMAFLDLLGIHPATSDLPLNVYSSAVGASVVNALTEATRLKRNPNATHPTLYDPELDPGDTEWGLDVIATRLMGKGGESTAARHGWVMVVAYQIIDGQTQFVQVELALLRRSDWSVQTRGKADSHRHTAVTIASATQRLREHSVYLDPEYATPALRKIVEARRRARLS